MKRFFNFRFLILIIVIFAVNFSFAKLAPAVVRDQLVLEAIIVATLDGIAIFAMERIWHKAGK